MRIFYLAAYNCGNWSVKYRKHIFSRNKSIHSVFKYNYKLISLHACLKLKGV
jgi:hypothetical protein